MPTTTGIVTRPPSRPSQTPLRTPGRTSGRARAAALTALVIVLALFTGCTGGASKGGANKAGSGGSGAATGAGHQQRHGSLRLDDLSSTRPITITDAGVGTAPGPHVSFLTHLFSATPSGPLGARTALTFTLPRRVAADTPVVVATREKGDTSWTYLRAHLDPDRRHVHFITRHLSLFGVLTLDVGALVSAVKTEILDGLTDDNLANIAAPRCDREDRARQDGFTITSSSTRTVLWCFGMTSDGRRVLKVTDGRRFPLRVAHPNMATLSNDLDAGAWASASRFGSGKLSILVPGSTIVYNADLEPGQSEGISTELDSWGQMFYLFQVSATTLASIVTRYGFGEAPRVATIAETMLKAGPCFEAVRSGSGGDMIAECFGPSVLYDAFGPVGLLLAPVMAAAPLVTFLLSEWDTLKSQFDGSDRYQILIRRAAAPPPPPPSAGTPPPGTGTPPTSTPTSTVGPFARTWYGHTRFFEVKPDGTVHEHIGNGCCNPIAEIYYRLSNVAPDGDGWSATLLVTRIDVLDDGAAASLPKVGQSGTVTLHEGVIDMPLTQTNYCNEEADLAGTCGA